MSKVEKKNTCFCRFCGRGYTKESYLVDHYLYKHAGAEFLCDFCGRNLSQPQVLKRHMLTCSRRPGAVLRRTVATNTIYSYGVNNEWVCQYYIDTGKPCGMCFNFEDEQLYYQHIATHFNGSADAINMFGTCFVGCC